MHTRTSKVNDAQQHCCYAHIRRYLLEAILPKTMRSNYSLRVVQSYITISCSSISRSIRKKSSHTSRLVIVASKTRNQSLMASVNVNIKYLPPDETNLITPGVNRKSTVLAFVNDIFPLFSA
jgi:hypothetical protein